jgi:hypothetical protein
MNKLLSVLIVLVLAASFLGCDKESDSGGLGGLGPGGDSSGVADYWPLTMGNSWTFTQWDWTAPATDTSEQTYSVTIVDTATIFNGTKAYHASNGNWLAIVSGEFRKYDSGPPTQNQTDYDTWIKEPIQVNNTWFGGMYETDSTWYTITATDVTVTVPAGTFTNCLHIIYSATGYADWHDYYAPGVGYVRYYTASPGSFYEEGKLIAKTIN